MHLKSRKEDKQRHSDQERSLNLEYHSQGRLGRPQEGSCSHGAVNERREGEREGGREGGRGVRGERERVRRDGRGK